MADGKIENLANVGAGWMGASISTVCSIAGYSLTATDLAGEALERFRRKVRWNLDLLVEAEEITREQADTAMTKVRVTTELRKAIAPADLVIEAVPEDLEMKQSVFKNIEPLAPETAILSTNASRIPTTQIASVCQRPERIVGIHFFEPPYILRAVEAIRGEHTSDETFTAAVAFIESIGSEPIRVVKDRDSFVINDLQGVIRRESTMLAQEGVADQGEVERAALHSFGIKIAALGQFKTGRVKSQGPGYEYSDEGLAEVKRRSFALIEVARAAKRAQAIMENGNED